MMNVLFFLIFVIIIEQPKEVNAETVSISGNITDFQNTNGKEIECSFTGKISSMVFLAKNKSSGTFESIAYSNVQGSPNITLTDFGNNIFDNVTTSFQTGSKSIIFNGLSCLHVREYQCQIWIPKIGGGYKSIESMVMHIIVKVRPSKPEMSYTTLDQHENSTKSSTNNTKFKWSLPLMSKKRAFNEGDNITFKCDGDVGRPKGNFIWQKIYSNKRRFNYTSLPTETTPENCTFSGTSNLTIQVTAEDNLAKIRCIVKSDVSEVEMSADSEPLLIYFQVREPYISVEPNETVYKEGELVQLNCKGYGNPYPSFSWTKHSKGNISDETISDNDTLVIQNVTLSDNGLFTCNTSNEINGEIYSASRSTDIIIVEVPSVVRINQNITKREHSNGIKLNCTYDIGSQDTFESIALAAQNISTDQFQHTAGRWRNTTQTLTAFGVYLFGNDTAVLNSKNALMLEFNNLERRHERLYKCILNVYTRNNPFNPEPIESDVMTINVTAEEITITDSEHKTDTIVVVAVLVPCIVLPVLAVAVVVRVKRRRRQTQGPLLKAFDGNDVEEEKRQTRDTDSVDTSMYANPQDDVNDTSSNSRYKKEKNCEQNKTVKNISQNKEHHQENDMYADPKDGVYEKLGEKRYKKKENCEQFDTIKNISAESNKPTKSKDSTIMLKHNTKRHDQSSGYESVEMEGATPVLLSTSNGNEQFDANLIKQHNEKYLQKQKEEDDKEKKSHGSHQHVEYAQVDETKKLKNKSKQNDKHQETAELHEDTKFESEEMHAKTDVDEENVDEPTSRNNENSDKETASIVASDHIMGRVNSTFETDDVSSKDETIKVAMVSPMIRMAEPPIEHTQIETTNAESKDRFNLSETVDDDDDYCNAIKNSRDQQTNSDQETAKRNDQTNTYTNQTFETEEDQLADEVSSQFRLLDGFQDGRKRNQNVD